MKRGMAAGVVAAASFGIVVHAIGFGGTADRQAVAAAAPLAGGVTGQVVKVVDGDTLDVRLPNGISRIRLVGLDTPETVKPDTPVQCWGPQASAYAHSRLDGQTVTLTADPTQDDVDRYGRLLRYVGLPDGSDYGTAALAAGMGRVYTYGHRPAVRFVDLVAAQTVAQEQRTGLWGACPT